MLDFHKSASGKGIKPSRQLDSMNEVYILHCECCLSCTQSSKLVGSPICYDAVVQRSVHWLAHELGDEGIFVQCIWPNLAHTVFCCLLFSYGIARGLSGGRSA
eukprot:1144582-Pelagomonas_calceolata.AAC.3